MSIAVGTDAFVESLQSLGYVVEIRDGYALFDFEVPLGTLLGQTVRMALFIPADFPISPPPGPHVSPPIGHPAGAVHALNLGPDWEYWSRPHQHWATTDRTVRTYMAHVYARSSPSGDLV